MKTCSDILTNQHFIDTAPMAAAYERLTALTLVMIEQRISRGFLAHCDKVLKLVRNFVWSEWNNRQLTLKLDMLRSNTWRAQVLKELGGDEALARWDRRMERYKIVTETPLTPAQAGVWRKTPERIEEELRQKAHAQKCGKATAHPRIFRDPFRVDQEGKFRLAPIPRPRLRGDKRTRRSSEEVLSTTPFYIERYEYNGMLVKKMTGYDAPVSIWPAEFRAAALLESRDKTFQSRHADLAFAAQTQAVPMPESLATEQHCILPLYQGMGSGMSLEDQTHGRNDKINKGALISNDDPP